MRLLLDEHHSDDLAAQLRAKGFDVVAATERAELRGHTDEGLLSAAVSEARVVVTENMRHFLPLAADWSREGRSHYGIVCTSPERFPRTMIGPLLRALVTFLEQHPGDEPDLIVWLDR